MVEPLHQDAIAGEKPNWTVIPVGEQRAAPYVAICQIFTEDDNGGACAGTGWLTQDGIVLTAGHLLFDEGFRATRCSVFWPLIDAWQVAARFRHHPQYRAPNGAPRVGSSADVGKIWGIERLPPIGLPTKAPSGGLIEVAAFQDGEMVRGKGAWKSVPPFVGHGADALSGHSGAPVLSGGHAVGIHVAAAHVSRAYLPPTVAQRLDTLNSAVGLFPETIGFSIA